MIHCVYTDNTALVFAPREEGEILNDILVAAGIGLVGATISVIWAWKSAEKEAEKVAKEVVRECWEEWQKKRGQRPVEICRSSFSTSSESTPTNASAFRINSDNFSTDSPLLPADNLTAEQAATAADLVFLSGFSTNSDTAADSLQ